MRILVSKRERNNLPEQLTKVKPPVKNLWYRGVWQEDIFTKCAAVVGSRRVTRYGRQVVEDVVPRLVNSGYTIISGLMYGVDQLAHKETLKAGGKAVAVLGYGIVNKNEEEAWKLAEQIESKGGLVLSEYAGEQVSQRWMFPQRNRIVVGLSDLIVIVEAGAKSGSLLTARMALKAGKPVYAVPGSIFSPTSEGTNELISRGDAKALTMTELGQLTGRANGKILGVSAKMNAEERAVYRSLKIGGPQSTNELGRHLAVPAREVLTVLSQMEMKNLTVNERGVWRILS